MITVGQQLAGGRETINALPGRSAFPFLRPLVRDMAKAWALGILSAPPAPVLEHSEMLNTPAVPPEKPNPAGVSPTLRPRMVLPEASVIPFPVAFS